jgi:superfamily II DNA or RNA helicase
MKLRPYQVDATNAIFRELKENDTALAVLHTALGKAVIITQLVEEVKKHRPDFRAIIMVRQVKLVKQMIEKFSDSSAVGAVCGSMGKYNQDASFVVASFETLRHRLHQKYDLCIIDEAHQTTKPMWEVAKSISKKLVGFTATDYTNKGFIHGEDKFWNTPCYKSTEEIADKYLCPIIMTGTKHKIDLKAIGHSAGDYMLSEAEERYTDSLLGKQLSEIRERTLKRNKVAIICCNIKHAERIKDMLPNSSITHSRLSGGEQQKNMESWENGDIKFMISVNQITTGFDFPALDCIVALRPTRSYTLYVQFLGRGRRKHPSKRDCLFLDYGNIVENLGLLKDVESNIIEKKPSCKLCPMCEEFLPTSQEVCGCGFSFILPVSVQRKAGDYEKNLSVYAYTEGEVVSAITTAHHVSQAGNKCLKILFWGGMKLLHTEFVMPHPRAKIDKLLERIIYPRSPVTDLENIREQILAADMIVKSIVLKKEGRYKVLHQTRW